MSLYALAYCIWPSGSVQCELNAGFLAGGLVGGVEFGCGDFVDWSARVPDDTGTVVTDPPGTASHNTTDPDSGLRLSGEETRVACLANAHG